MYPRDIRVADPQEALVVEQALAMYRELRKAAADAPDGQVIHIAEQVAITSGRELTRRSLETVLQDEARAHEKKVRTSGSASAEAVRNIGADSGVRF